MKKVYNNEVVRAAIISQVRWVTNIFYNVREL